MTPEELEKIKNMWGKARGRTIQIVDRDQMDRLTFELHNKIAAMIAHIDSQAAQIEALKEKLLEKQCQLMPAAPGCYADARMEAARQQLMAEMPEVEWE